MIFNEKVTCRGNDSQDIYDHHGFQRLQRLGASGLRVRFGETAKKKGYIDSMSDDYALTVIHTCYMCREIPVPSGFLLGAMVIAGSFGSQCSSSHVARFGS